MVKLRVPVSAVLAAFLYTPAIWPPPRQLAVPTRVGVAGEGRLHPSGTHAYAQPPAAHCAERRLGMYMPWILRNYAFIRL